MEVQAPLAHDPPVQVRLQHSSFAPQVTPAALQNWVELHLWVVVLHAVEQQSAFFEQLSPPSWQAFWTGVVQVPPVHWPEQQSLALEHAVAPARHCPAGSTQTFVAQEFVQQSALDPQTSPTALHCEASTQVPLHAPEQQSDGSAQLAESALQVATGAAGWPELHAAPTSRRNDVKTKIAVLPGERMDACSAFWPAGAREIITLGEGELAHPHTDDARSHTDARGRLGYLAAAVRTTRPPSPSKYAFSASCATKGAFTRQSRSFTTATATATCGSSTGAKPTNQE